MYKIIIADDHAIVRQGVKMMLHGEPDFDVPDEVESGDELIRMLSLHDYALILLDISMPGKDVFDVIENIKRLGISKPILIFSMNPEELYAKRLLNAGASGYLNKGAPTDEILKAIRKVIQGGYYITPTLAESIAPMLFKGGEKTPHENLTSREFQILCTIASGKSLTEIADMFFISKATVSNHRTNILKKLNMKNNYELMQYAIKNGLIN